MMRQASVKENQIKKMGKIRCPKTRQQLPEMNSFKIKDAKLNTEEQSRLKELRRPASTDPGHQMRKQDREEEKRMSAFANVPDFGDRVMEPSQSRSSMNRGSSEMKSRTSSNIRLTSRDTSRLSGTSSGLDSRASSRALNISSDSGRDDSYHNHSSSHQSNRNSSRDVRETPRSDLHAGDHQRSHQSHQRRPESPESQLNQIVTRPSSKSSYYFGEDLDLEPPESLPRQIVTRPSSKSSYYFGENLDLEPTESLPNQTVSRTSSKSSYYFGEAPELEEIFANLNCKDESVGGDSVTTPVNEPMKTDILHNSNCYQLHEHLQEGPYAKSDAGEVVRIRVPFSEPHEPLEPFLTAQHNIEILAAQQISSQYNGHKLSIQVNHEKQSENEPFPAQPASKNSSNFTTREVGRQQVTKRHIASKEKQV